MGYGERESGSSEKGSIGIPYEDREVEESQELRALVLLGT
jgi:hypothetical protein